jgi:3-mercaptopyruvate sulfurtransferase SseA
MSHKDVMRLSLFIALSAALAAGIACTQQNAPPEQAAKTPAANSSPVTVITPAPVDANRITVTDAKKELDAGTAVFVDVRAEAAYKQEHIKGALHMPLESLDANLGKLPKGKKLIIYCS